MEIKEYLKNKFNSLTNDYKNQGNMVDVSEFLSSDRTYFGQRDSLNELLIPMVDFLVKNGIDINNIKVGTIVDDTWGWRIKDIQENGIPGDTLWVETNNDELMNNLNDLFNPNEFSIYKNKYRLWWD